MNNSLEPDLPEIRKMLELTSDKIIQFIQQNHNPVSYNADKSTQQAQLLREQLPQQETPLETILEQLFEHKIVHALPATHPGFMAYIPGGGIFYAALADMIAKVTNRYIGIEVTAPFLSQIETNVIQWFCEMVGYSNNSGGTLTSGGSIANLTAVICARTLIMGDAFSTGTVYASGYVHHSMWKAFHAAGISAAQIRNIPVDKNHRLDVKELAKSIQADKQNGLTPLMVVATAGSTNTGSIDDLIEIAEITKDNNCWFHVDAAYGGFFALTETGKAKLKGIELADSITLDPHKGLFLPYGTGAFIVKDRQKLISVFSHRADYIPDKKADQSLWDFSAMSLELTRPFRGLAVWLPFKLLGVDVFENALNEKLQLAEYFHHTISQFDEWKIIASPELSLTVFRYTAKDKTSQQLDEINRAVLEWVNHKGRVNISGTIIDNSFVIRNCILCFRTHREQLDFLIEDLNLGLKDTLLKQQN